MKKKLLILLTLFITITSYTQINFEKGYFIDNSDKKINCLIKNLDPLNNPFDFEYKLSESSNLEKATIKSVKEFGVYNIFKFIRATVNIDQSDIDDTNNIDNLTTKRDAVFKEEELFLKVLIEGKSNLYKYTEGNSSRFFYTKDDFKIDQLIFKTYKSSSYKINENNKFRQQLWVDLKCSNFTMDKIKNIDYNEKDLVQFFTEYSECHNVKFVNYESKIKRIFFNLNLRPHFNFSSLKLPNNRNTETIDFGTTLNFGFGAELEFILPFKGNKWALAVEPIYHSYSSEKTTSSSTLIGGESRSVVTYNSVHIPLKLRYYLFLNDNSKIFINASYITDFNFNSSIDFKRKDGSTYSSADIESVDSFSAGIGYKLNNTYSIELRAQGNRNFLRNYREFNSDYSVISVIFGYTIFQIKK